MSNVSMIDWETLDALEGLVSPELGRELAGLAFVVPRDQAIVELGSFRGKSTSYLAAGAAAGRGAHVWAFDAWDLDGNETGKHRYHDARAGFDAQIVRAGVAEWITATQSFSVDAARAWDGPPVGMIYVDADHQYRSVWNDTWSWWPHLVEGAIVCYDDYETKRNPGVKQAVDRIAGGGHLHGLMIAAGQLAIGTKVTP